MEIRDLRVFRTVVEAGGVTKAAALLHMTPGAVSKALRRFEDELGRSLFIRGARHLVPSERGRELYRRSARLMTEHKRLLTELDASSPEHDATLRIASFEVFTTHCLGPVLASAFPDREVQMLDVGVGAIEDAVRNREVDYGVTYVPFPHHDLHYEPVRDVRFGIWGHGLTFDGIAFAELPFAIPVTRLQLAAGELLGIDCWPYDRVPRRVKYRLTALESALALARHRQCVVFIPDFIGELHNRAVRRSMQLRRFPSPAGVGTVTQTVRVVVREEDRDAPGLRQVVRAYSEAMAR